MEGMMRRSSGGAGGGELPAGGQPPRKKRKSQPPTMTITSGVRSNVVKFQWKIENFSAIRHNKKLLQAQQFSVTLGAPVGVPCKWTFSLNSETEVIPPAIPSIGNNDGNSNDPTTVEWLEIMRKLVQTPDDSDDVCNSCSLKIRDKEKKTFFKGYGSMNNLKLNGFRTFKKVLRMSDKSSLLPLIDGALIIDITLSTFAPRTVSTENSDVTTEFSQKWSEKLSADQTKLLTEGSESTFSDVKIIAKDGKEFHAHRCILASRNPVFQAMFASNLTERQSGVIQVEDLGGKALELLLKYIYGGSMSDAWFQPDVIVEFTYGAGKYQLTEVLEFLDSVLGSRCQGVNCGQLLALCDKLNLKKAEQEILSYIKNCAVPSASNYAELSAIFDNTGGV